jgi:hypothetical protein
MSKIKVKGHDSGTGVITIEAPNTSTDRTLTLPDSTDTLAVNGDVTNKLPLAGGTVTGTLYATHTGGIEVNSTSHAYLRVNSSASSTASWINFKQGGTGRWLAGVEGSDTGWQLYDNAGGSTVLKVTQDGRGLSQFTAKAWVSYNHQTPAINDSHNISSVTDSATGQGVIYIDVNTASANTSVAMTAGKGPNDFSSSNFTHCGISESSTAGNWWFGTIKNDAVFDSANVNGVCFGD